MSEISLEGYALEKFRQGWAIKKLRGEEGGESYLAYGDEEGFEIQYFNSSREAKKKLIELLREWNEQEADFVQKPSEIIKL